METPATGIQTRPDSNLGRDLDPLPGSESRSAMAMRPPPTSEGDRRGLTPGSEDAPQASGRGPRLWRGDDEPCSLNYCVQTRSLSSLMSLRFSCLTVEKDSHRIHFPGPEGRPKELIGVAGKAARHQERTKESFAVTSNITGPRGAECRRPETSSHSRERSYGLGPQSPRKGPRTPEPSTLTQRRP